MTKHTCIYMNFFLKKLKIISKALIILRKTDIENFYWIKFDYLVSFKSSNIIFDTI